MSGDTVPRAISRRNERRAKFYRRELTKLRDQLDAIADHIDHILEQRPEEGNDS